MPRLAKVLLAPLAIVLLLAFAGCSGRADGDRTTPAAEEWNKLADERAAVIEEQKALHETLLDLTRRTLAMDPFSDDAPDALVLLEDRGAGLVQATRNARTLVRLWDASAKLPLAPAYRTFALQQKEIQEFYLRWYANDRQWVRIDKGLFERASELSPADAAELIHQKADLRAEADELSSSIDEKEQAAERYWNEHVLGQ